MVNPNLVKKGKYTGLYEVDGELYTAHVCNIRWPGSVKLAKKAKKKAKKK